MADLKRDVVAAEMGFDAARLNRLDRHFARYVDDGRLPGWLILVSRFGKIVHLSTYGWRDVEAGAPLEEDTVFRIFSMTKPITSVAAMMLYEEGTFELKDPVSRFIPAFTDMRVYRSGSSLKPTTEPATEPVRLWHLLTHTAGLTYGFHSTHPVDALYRAAGFEWGTPLGADLAACCEQWARFPLLFQPGTEWNYSVATDVLGRVVELASGQRLDHFFAERIFKPLGMIDTGFAVPAASVNRLAALYTPAPDTLRAIRHDGLGEQVLRPPTCLSGGGGLVSTAADYHRFTQLLLQGGELDGTRLLSPRTFRYMTRNHLPGGADLETFGRPLFAETTFTGVGFGLGLAVMDDPVAGSILKVLFDCSKLLTQLTKIDCTNIFATPPRWPIRCSVLPANWLGVGPPAPPFGWIRARELPLYFSPSCCRRVPTRSGHSCDPWSTRPWSIERHRGKRAAGRISRPDLAAEMC